LGIGSNSRGSSIPVVVDGLGFTKIVKIRAGLFSAGLSAESQLYIWGSGAFGEFSTPHRVKSVNALEVLDF
jgi:alpha-tubulin suppressor-like RCC1 family protein